MTDVIESKAETVESVDGFDPSGDVLTAFTFPGVESGAKALIVTLIGGVLADAIGKIHNASASAYRAARANAQWWLLHDTRDAAAVGSAAWCFNELDLDRDVIARAVEKRWADSGVLLPFHDRKWGPYWQWEAAPLRAPLPLTPQAPIALRAGSPSLDNKRDRRIAEATARRVRQFTWDAVVRTDYLATAPASEWRIPELDLAAVATDRPRPWLVSDFLNVLGDAADIATPDSIDRAATLIGPRGMYPRAGKLAALCAAILAGDTTRAAGRKAGCNRETARKVQQILMTLLCGAIRCQCGEVTGHRGWCSVRFQRSPGRQALMARFHARDRAKREQPLAKLEGERAA